MTLHKGNLHQIQWRKILLLCTQQQPWRKIFPLGIKAIFAILRQSMYDHRENTEPQSRQMAKIFFFLSSSSTSSNGLVQICLDSFTMVFAQNSSIFHAFFQV